MTDSWRCMEDGGSEYVAVEATSIVEAAETYACEHGRHESGHETHMRVIVLDPEADADDEADERYHVVDVVCNVVVTAHGAVVP